VVQSPRFRVVMRAVDEGVSPSRRPLVQQAAKGGSWFARFCAMAAGKAPSSTSPKRSQALAKRTTTELP
jgi:hypothetical protein